MARRASRRRRSLTVFPAQESTRGSTQVFRAPGTINWSDGSLTTITSVSYTPGSPSRRPITLRGLFLGVVVGVLFWSWWLTAGKDVGLDVFARTQIQKLSGAPSVSRP